MLSGFHGISFIIIITLTLTLQDSVYFVIMCLSYDTNSHNIVHYQQMKDGYIDNY